MTKIIRLFLSSTFVDFSHERDRLQSVWASLRDYTRRKRTDVGFQVVDLRWGIPPADFIRTNTMDTCLGEVRRSRDISLHPHFMLLCGDRYGWRPLPERIPGAWYDRLRALFADQAPAAAELLPTLYREDQNFTGGTGYRLIRAPAEAEEALLQSRLIAAAPQLEPEIAEAFLTSATHHEINLGLNRPAESRPEKALVYLRGISDIPDHGFNPRLTDARPDQPQERCQDAKHRIAALTERLRAEAREGAAPQLHLLERSLSMADMASAYGEGLEPPVLSPAYAQSLEDLAAWTEVRLISLIDSLPTTPPEALSRRSPRPPAKRITRPSLDSLAAEIRTATAGCWAIVGPSGSGRSAALEGIAAALAPEPGAELRLLEMRRSTWNGVWSVRALLSRAITALSPPATGQTALLSETELTGWLQALLSAPGEPPVTLLIDDADLLTSEAGPGFGWLPVPEGKCCRIVITLHEASLGVLRCGWPAARVCPLPEPSAQFLRSFFTHRLAERESGIGGRRLQPEQLEAAVAQSLAAQLPLLALETVAESLSGLFHDEVLSGDPLVGWREGLQSRHGPKLIQAFLDFLALSRAGLSEAEIAELIWQDPAARGEFIARAHKSHVLPRMLPQIVLSRLLADHDTLLSTDEGEGNLLLFRLRSPRSVDASLLEDRARRLGSLLLRNWQSETAEAAPTALSPGGCRAAQALLASDFAGLTTAELETLLTRDFTFLLAHCALHRLGAYTTALQRRAEVLQGAGRIAAFLLANREMLTRSPDPDQTARVLLQRLEETGEAPLEALARTGREACGLPQRLICPAEDSPRPPVADLPGHILRAAETGQGCLAVLSSATIPAAQGTPPLVLTFLHLIRTREGGTEILAGRALPATTEADIHTGGDFLALRTSAGEALIFDSRTLDRVAAESTAPLRIAALLSGPKGPALLDNQGGLHFLCGQGLRSLPPPEGEGALLMARTSPDRIVIAREGSGLVSLCSPHGITPLARFEAPFPEGARLERHGTAVVSLAKCGDIRIVTDSGRQEQLTLWPGQAVKVLAVEGLPDGLFFCPASGERIFLWPARHELSPAELKKAHYFAPGGLDADLRNGVGLDWACGNPQGAIMFGGARPLHDSVTETAGRYARDLRRLGLGPEISTLRHLYFGVRQAADAHFLDLSGAQQPRSLKPLRSLYPAPWRAELAERGGPEASRLQRAYRAIPSMISRSFGVPGQGCVSLDIWGGAVFWPLEGLSRNSGVTMAPHLGENVIHAEALDPRYVLVADGRGAFVVFDTMRRKPHLREDGADGAVLKQHILPDGSVLIEWETGTFRLWDPETARLGPAQRGILGRGAELLCLSAATFLESLPCPESRNGLPLAHSRIAAGPLSRPDGEAPRPAAPGCTVAFTGTNYVVLHAERAISVFDRHSGVLRSRGAIDAPFPYPDVTLLGGPFFTLSYSGFNVWRDLILCHAGLGRSLACFVPLPNEDENYRVTGTTRGDRLSLTVTSARETARYDFRFDGDRLWPLPPSERGPQRPPAGHKGGADAPENDHDFLDDLFSDRRETGFQGHRNSRREATPAWAHRGGILTGPTARPRATPPDQAGGNWANPGSAGILLRFERQITIGTGGERLIWEAPLTAALIGPGLLPDHYEAIDSDGRYLHLELRRD